MKNLYSKIILFALAIAAALVFLAGCEGGPPTDPNICEDPLSAPSLTTPASNATEVSLQVSFDWNDVTGAEGYIIEIYEGSSCSGTPVEEDETTSSSYTSTNLEASTTYAWRVMATDTNSACDSNFSTCRQFTTAAT